jgi:YidC/Oxa1 family membrane protein insertase
VTASIAHTLGSVFQPIFRLFGWLLAFFYGLIPNYAVAIILLTIVIMGVLTPFTIKSTRSMSLMQAIQPEIKKLQQKYKGPENRQILNEELMRLYREKGVNPLGGCLPLFLQMPFLFILYSVIKGLSYVTPKGVSAPRYIPTSSTMYHHLVQSAGQVRSFGMDLSLKPFPVSAHGGWVGAIPFFALVILAVGLQYFQMAMINNRNRKKGQPMPSQAMALQRIMPIFLAYIYFIIPAAVVVYMVVSSGIRIITQYFMFKAGLMDADKVSEKNARTRPKAREAEREIPAPEHADDAPALEAPSPPPRPPAPAKRPATPKPSTPRNAAAQSRSRSKRKRKAR